MNIHATNKPGVIYLAGPIHGRTDDDCANWRHNAAALWGHDSVLDPLRRDYRGKELENLQAVVELDLLDIQHSDGMLVKYDQPSVGTSMEIFYAATVRRIPIVVWNTTGKAWRDLPPWLVYHADAGYGELPLCLTVLSAMIDMSRGDRRAR